MELDLKELRRDWIDGINGDAFYARTVETRDQLSTGTVILNKTDPFQFAATFFAAVAQKVPIALANPNWQPRELTQFHQQLETTTPPPGSILIPTGGTTGGVKLAIHNWSSLVAASTGLQTFLGGGAINSCCLLPLYHVSGLMQIVRSFVSGGHLRFNDSNIHDQCLSLVPTQLQRAIQSPESIKKLNTARVLFIGGAPMSVELASNVRQLQLPIMPVYGMTETAAMCAAIPIEDFLQDPEAGALAIGDTRFSIDSDQRIRIHSSALFTGYQGRDAINRQSGYVTGDIGRLRENGRLHVGGRADNIIITGGEKVDPAEIEAVLIQIDGITAAKVFGQPDNEWGQRVIAHFTGAPEAANQAWKAALKAKLAPHKIPKELIYVENSKLISKFH